MSQIPYPPSVFPLPSYPPPPPPETSTSIPVDQAVTPTLPPSITDPGYPVGELPDVPDNVSPDQLGDSFYTDASIDGLYEGDMGLLAIPVAGPPGTPAEIVRIHAPTATRVVEWTVEYTGGQVPRWPAPSTANPNEFLARWKVWPATPAIGPDGTEVFRLTGRYEYALLVPPVLGIDALAAGTDPYTTIPAAANNVSPAAASAALLDSSSAVPQGFTPPPLAG